MSEEEYSEVQMGSINHEDIDEYIEEDKVDDKKGHDWFQHIHNSPSHMQSCSFKADGINQNQTVPFEGQMPNEIDPELAHTLKNETAGAARLRKMLLSGNCGQDDLANYVGVRNTA